jgi:1-aminocyclopropane-1-carboxylate deaminase/D-cysteine desulfhydrase-like pyridoxal-dependent ACC family enzyme
LPERSGHPVLFEHYPDLSERLDWISLGALPTPIQRLSELGIENLWIKRDDLSSSVYGGNKVRKLEFILAAAKRRKGKRVITFGGIGTNHGLATAIFCHQLGMACTLLLFWQPVTQHVQSNLRLFHNFQANMVYTKTLWRAVLRYYLLERIKHPRAYYVFAGGSNAEGTVGFVDAALELKKQVAHGEMPEPAAIICPLGSGGTMAGLSLGCRIGGLGTRVIGVRVSASHLGPFPACTPGTVMKLMQATYGFLKKRCPTIPAMSMDTPLIVENYLGEGYGFPTEEGTRAYRFVKEKANIVLEPTYTAKTFAAVMDYCRSPQESTGPVLYWHTYNAVDLSGLAESVDDQALPKPLRKFVTETPLAV